MRTPFLNMDNKHGSKENSRIPETYVVPSVLSFPSEHLFEQKQTVTSEGAAAGGVKGGKEPFVSLCLLFS